MTLDAEANQVVGIIRAAGTASHQVVDLSRTLSPTRLASSVPVWHLEVDLGIYRAEVGSGVTTSIIAQNQQLLAECLSAQRSERQQQGRTLGFGAGDRWLRPATRPRLASSTETLASWSSRLGGVKEEGPLD